METTERLTATITVRAPEGHLLRRLKVLTWFVRKMGLEPVGPIEIEAARTEE